jgi:hypothetical protein
LTKSLNKNRNKKRRAKDRLENRKKCRGEKRGERGSKRGVAIGEGKCGLFYSDGCGGEKEEKRDLSLRIRTTHMA